MKDEKYRIGEFAAMTGLPPSRIRFYEKYGLWDIDRSTAGYRYYTPEDAFRLNAFRMLLQYGFTVEESARMLDDEYGTKTFQARMEKQRRVLEAASKQLQKKIQMIDAIRENLNLDHDLEYEVVDADDYLYVPASVGRDFHIACKYRKLLASLVELLPFSRYARILERENLISGKTDTDPSYVIALPYKDRELLSDSERACVHRLCLGKCVRFSRRLNREESAQRKSFEKLFTYLKDHGYEIRSAGVIFPCFLNLDEMHRDLEMVLIPIR